MDLAGGQVRIRRVSKVDPASGDLLSLDLLLVTPVLEEVWRTRLQVEGEQGSVWVVSRAGLITLKRLRGSGQDRDDIQRLEGDEP